MRRLSIGIILASCAIGLALGSLVDLVAGQVPPDLGARLLADPAVVAALQAAKDSEPEILAKQVAVCEVPAPPFKESERAALMRREFEAAGLKAVRIDKSGNVLGVRPGRASRPNLVVAAHLDTVFPEGTNVKTTREGAVIKGPGIGDNCRGLALLLAIVRALDAGRVRTSGQVTFVANVGEEGLGDLRGVKHLFNEELKGQIDAFVAIDGTGYGITNVGVGSHRYRVTYRGPGGHSYGAFGLPNPIHALGRAIAKVSDFQVATNPKTTFNVGRIGGGTSVNSIAYEAWMEMDMRSPDEAALSKVDAQFKEAVASALAEENARWGGEARLTVETDLVGDRPAGQTPQDSVIVQTAVAVTRALGLPIELGDGSTDSNIPMNLGIPAVTIDGGGRGKGGHSLAEQFDSTDSWKGTQRAVLLVIALASAPAF
ncbi:MAG: M20/M25/M40 family metallo-hydrolase [Vicinamibacterales bacterium]